MATEPATVPLGDLCVRITKGTTPTTLGRRFVERGVNFVKSESITDDGRIDNSKFAFVDLETHEALRRSILQEGDVLFSMAGVYLGKTAVVPPHILPANTNQAVGIIRLDQTKADPRFIHYALSSPVCRGFVERGVAQSAQPNFNLRDIGALPIPALPVSEQRAIAQILGALDDKIELNRRMSETLEAMARALLKSWFVDFDPVRAKAEGRDPGLPKSVAELFPSRLFDSELGEIPEGWEVSTIGASAEVIDCLHAKKPERRDSGLPLLQLVNIRDDGLLDMTETYLIDDADYRRWISRMEASPGDCVITNVGRVGAVSQIPIGQKAALGRNMTGLRCQRDFPFPTVLIEALLSRAMREEISLKLDTGTILEALNVRNIPRLRFVRGTRDVLTLFEQSCRPYRARMESLLVESRTLAAVRDTLLPKLISGEVKVRDASRLAGGAG